MATANAGDGGVDIGRLEDLLHRASLVRLAEHQIAGWIGSVLQDGNGAAVVRPAVQYRIGVDFTGIPAREDVPEEVLRALAVIAGRTAQHDHNRPALANESSGEA